MLKSSGFRIVTSALFVLGLPAVAYAFKAAPACSGVFSRPTDVANSYQHITLTASPKSRLLLRQTADDKGGHLDEQNLPTSRRGEKKVGRLGGRKRKQLSKQSETGSMKNGFKRWALPTGIFFAFMLFLKSLFSGGVPNDPSFVYYESSFYESRTYNGNGQVETSRKESVRSNVPSLLEDKRLREGSRSDSSYLLQEYPDENFEKELNEIMEFRRTIFDDFF